MTTGSSRPTLASLTPGSEQPARALRAALHHVSSEPDAPNAHRALHRAVAEYLRACSPRPPISELLAVVLAEAEALDRRSGPLIAPHGPARQAALHTVVAHYYGRAGEQSQSAGQSARA